MPLYGIDGLRPVIHRDAFVHPDAVLIGDVTVGAGSSIWPTAVLRGDFGRIVVGERTSVQDGTVVHATPSEPTLIGDACVVGHNAHLEGCEIGDHCLVGSMSAVLNGARVGPGSQVGGGAFVSMRMVVAPGMRALGLPAKVTGPVPADFRAWLEDAVEIYAAAAARYALGLTVVSLEECSPPAN